MNRIFNNMCHLQSSYWRICRCFVSPSAAARGSQLDTSVPPQRQVRLSKLVAQQAQISRNEAERLIRSGSVSVAGKPITVPQTLFDTNSTNNNVIKLHNKTLQPIVSSSSERTRVWIVHKLKGELVTETDPHDRPSVLQRLRKSMPKHHIKAIGRLDMMTEGLLLLTSDGNYARQMELPSNKLHRTYRVRVHGASLVPHKIQQLQKGLMVDGVRYAPMKVATTATPSSRFTRGTNSWIQITCCEGKNRQIRNVLRHLGCTVSRLIRISYGDYELQTIPPGMAIEVPVKPLEQQKRRGSLFPNKTRKDASKTAAEPVQWIRHA